MTRKLRSIILTVATIALAAIPTFALPSLAFAVSNNVDIGGSLCSGTVFNLNGTGNCATGQSNFQNLLGQIINIFSIIVGVIAVIMIIVGGLRYITSGGESGKVSAAKTTIMYALIGLVVVALAQLIVHFVLSQSNNIANGG